MQDDTLRPAISIHKIPVSGSAAGLLFTAGSMLVFLFGIPSVRLFFAAAIPIGAGVALALNAFHKHRAAVPQKILKLQ